MKVWNDWAWVKVSVLTCLPGLLIVAYKLAIDYGTQKNAFKKWEPIVDWIFRTIFGYCFIYYILDSLSIILLGRLFKTCYLVYFLHHIFSGLGLRLVFSTKKRIFWFEALVATMHSFVLTYPKINLMQYCYVSSFVILVIMIFVKPYCLFDECVSIRKYIVPVLLSFVGMQYYNCLNMLDAVHVDRSTD